MAQFQVPQFIETEDKIVGPLTLREFGYLAVAGAVAFGAFFIFEFFLWLIMAAFLGLLSAVLAFIKVNGRSITTILRAALAYYVLEPRLYTFRRPPEKPKYPPAKRVTTPSLGNLRLLWETLLTSKAAIPKREKPLTQSFGFPGEKEIKERYEMVRKISGEGEVARRVDYR